MICLHQNQTVRDAPLSAAVGFSIIEAALGAL